jgi:hypothetical protein
MYPDTDQEPRIRFYHWLELIRRILPNTQSGSLLTAYPTSLLPPCKTQKFCETIEHVWLQESKELRRDTRLQKCLIQSTLKFTSTHNLENYIEEQTNTQKPRNKKYFFGENQKP